MPMKLEDLDAIQTIYTMVQEVCNDSERHNDDRLVQSFEDDNEKCSAKFPSMKGKCPKEPCTMTSCTEAGAVCNGCALGVNCNYCM
uniref:Uncharacterized protein n=1 Tax=Magallana gigas TaxID=29159 RepID=K1QU24_MAGGI